MQHRLVILYTSYQSVLHKVTLECRSLLDIWVFVCLFVCSLLLFISSSSSSGNEPPLVVESFGLLNNIFPFPSILDAGYPIFNLHLANVLFDVALPSILGSSL